MDPEFIARVKARVALEKERGELDIHDAGARLHSIWRGMRQRCENPKNVAFDRYGGVGISVCTEWLEFQPFFDWAMANGYAEGLTIDRKCNDQGYNPSNCRWATILEQSINRKTTVLITIDGETKCASVWARENGLTPSTVLRRHHQGWSGSKLLKPLGPNAREKNVNRM